MKLSNQITLPDAIVSQHMGVLGKTGSGKTSTAKLIIERVVADGSRVCILDPIKSDWWGLTSSADGKKAGLPFQILGGPRGHVPLHSSAGKPIAEVVSDGRLPLSIIDMADFEPGGQAKFFVDFAPTLLRKMKGVVYLVIEEAHLFAPKERSGIGQENMAIHWAKTMATAGRSKGIRIIVITHRTQALHNALLGSLDTLIAHRLTAPADQSPVVKWLKANVDAETVKKVEESLSSLKTGNGWVCSGEAKFNELVSFPRMKTYDNTATPTGEGSEHAVKMAPVDTNKLMSIIGKAAEEAKANDPAELKKTIRERDNKIRDLERQVNSKSPVIDQEAIDRAVSAEVSKRDQHWRGEIAKLETAHSSAIGTLRKINQLSAVNGEATVLIAQPADIPVHKLRTIQQKAPRTLEKAPQSLRRQPVASDDTGDIPKGEAAILTVAIHYPEGADSETIAVVTGYKATSRKVYIRSLVSKGLVEKFGKTIRATPAGVAALPDVEPLPSGEALRSYWSNRLTGGEKMIFDITTEHYPQAVSREAIEEATGYKATSIKVYTRALVARRIVERTGDGVRASDTLF